MNEKKLSELECLQRLKELGKLSHIDQEKLSLLIYDRDIEELKVQCKSHTAVAETFEKLILKHGLTTQIIEEISKYYKF